MDTAVPNPALPEEAHQKLRMELALLIANGLGGIVGAHVVAQEGMEFDRVEQIVDHYFGKWASSLKKAGQGESSPSDAALSEAMIGEGQNFIQECKTAFRKLYQQHLAKSPEEPHK